MGILDPTEQYLRLYRSQIQRALAVLQKAQRYVPRENWCEKTGKAMEPCAFGDWISIDDVVKAIQILQEGQP